MWITRAEMPVVVLYPLGLYNYIVESTRGLVTWKGYSLDCTPFGLFSLWWWIDHAEFGTWFSGEWSTLHAYDRVWTLASPFFRGKDRVFTWVTWLCLSTLAPRMAQLNKGTKPLKMIFQSKENQNHSFPPKTYTCTSTEHNRKSRKNINRITFCLCSSFFFFFETR